MHGFQPFYIVHVFSLFVLVGVAFVSIAHPREELRRSMLKWSGIASVVAFIAGFGMKGMLHIEWPLWIWVKILCWLIVSAMIGQIFRKPQQQRTHLCIVLGALLLALGMVYYKPA